MERRGARVDRRGQATLDYCPATLTPPADPRALSVYSEQPLPPPQRNLQSPHLLPRPPHPHQLETPLLRLPRPPDFWRFPTMLDSTTGDCWICGKVTKTKCGPCAESGIDIFFCSKEHQKLVRPCLNLHCFRGTDDSRSQVWYAHKRVCGAPAKEFALPSFDDEESQLYTALLSARLSTSNPGNEPINEMDELSLRRMMMLLLKVPETELLSVRRFPLPLRMFTD